MRKRIGIIVQRYGQEINGGAEQHARRIAERLVKKYDVSVITTTALSETWKQYYNEGIETINGVKVYRFSCASAKDDRSLRNARNALCNANNSPATEKICKIWTISQGPNCPKLIQYIKENKDCFEAFFFVTYLFYHTIMALPLVREKAILLPTAHDEPSFYFHDIYHSVFCGPKDFLFNSVEEQKLVHRVYRNEYIRNFVVGEGVDTPTSVDPVNFKYKMGLKDYVVYVGRIGTAKQCDMLVHYFTQYKRSYPGPLKLVLVGRSNLPTIPSQDIVTTGFVTDQEKFNAMAGAKCLIMPSLYESLCMAVLESLSVGTPVLVNGKCAVTRGHCKRGNCGLYYKNYAEFEACLNFLLKNDSVRAQMGKNGKRYVRDNYNWDITINRIDEIMRDYN